MPQRYHVVPKPDSPSRLDSRGLADILAQDGQILLPMLDLIENAQVAIDDLIDVMGRATIEAVLLMSAAGVAGPKQQGKKADRDIAYHGSQPGSGNQRGQNYLNKKTSGKGIRFLGQRHARRTG